MLRFRIPSGRAVPIFLALLSCCSIPSLGQESSGDFPANGKIVPAPVEPAPFSTKSARREPNYTVELRAADTLPEQDRLLIENAESSIAELAKSAGLEFSENGWNYNQIACPSFKNHVFLQFTRKNGSGDVSVFSASIPRNGVGRTRIIPILKRSYSLFSPAPINAITISAFNHIRTEEGQTANDHWLGNALCYAALAGAHPRILAADSWPVPQKPVPSLTAALDVQFNEKGREVISFDDMAARPHAMEWTMTFTRDGKLIKATHLPVEMLHAQPVPEISAAENTRQVP
jgi:hypothetical protein